MTPKNAAGRVRKKKRANLSPWIIPLITLTIKNNVSSLSWSRPYTARSAFAVLPSFPFPVPFPGNGRIPHPSRKTLLRMSSNGGGTSQLSSFSTVLLQKVVQSVPLPLLMEYIRDVFEIPSELAMPYERVVSFEDDRAEGGTIVSCFESPMDPSDSLLVVEVLGIRVGDEDELIPSMAMVAVKKRPSKNGGGAMQGLLDASEAMLIRALEMGMDDLVRDVGYKQDMTLEDKIEETDTKVDTVSNEKEASKNNIEVHRGETGQAKDVVIDIEPEKAETDEEKPAKKVEEKPEPSSRPSILTLRLIVTAVQSHASLLNLLPIRHRIALTSQKRERHRLHTPSHRTTRDHSRPDDKNEPPRNSKPHHPMTKKVLKIDDSSMYDPAIHLPDKPDFSDPKLGYEVGTPLSDELIKCRVILI